MGAGICSHCGAPIDLEDIASIIGKTYAQAKKENETPELFDVHASLIINNWYAPLSLRLGDIRKGDAGTYRVDIPLSIFSPVISGQSHGCNDLRFEIFINGKDKK